MINEEYILQQIEQLKKSPFADSRFIDGVVAVEILIITAPKIEYKKEFITPYKVKAYEEHVYEGDE